MNDREYEAKSWFFVMANESGKYLARLIKEKEKEYKNLFIFFLFYIFISNLHF